MPLFFILSGIFVNQSIEKRSIRGFVGNKIATLWYPYFVWTCIHISIQIALSDFTNADRDWVDFLLIFTAPRAIDHLWFLSALFWVTLTYLFLKKAIGLNNYWIIGISLATHYLSQYLKEYSLLSDPFYYLLFFALGSTFSTSLRNSKLKSKLSSGKGILAALPFFLASQWYWISYRTDIDIFLFAIIELVGSYFVIIMCFKFEKGVPIRVLRKIGDYSYPIYLCHVLISAAIRILATKLLDIENVLILLGTGVFFGTLCSMWAYDLSKKTGVTFIFTMPKFLEKKISG